MSSIGINRVTNFRVVKMATQETGTYNTQYSRPYRTVMDGSVIRLLSDRIATAPSGKLTSDVLSGITGSIMAPEATHSGEVKIVNGWDTRRIRFMLQVEFTSKLSGTETHYILGYTDYSGVNMHMGMHAHFDPSMVLYINSVVKTTKAVIPVGNGGYREIEKVVDASQVMADNQWGGIYAPVQKYAMRPRDIVGQIAISHLSSPYNDDHVNEAVVYDTGAMIRPQAIMSRRSNNLPSAYISQVANSYVLASQHSQFGDGDSVNNTIGTLERTMGRIEESEASMDPFLHMLSGLTHNVAGNSFTYGQLLKLDPNVDNVTVHSVESGYQGSGGMVPQGMNQQGLTSYWNGNDSNTHAAAILSQSVPAIMMELLIGKIVFESTNHTIGGAVETKVMHGVGFSTVDMTQHWQMFISRFEREVMANVTFGFTTSYRVQMIVDLLGETVIKISIGSNPVVDYVVPSFCDNLLAPTISQEKASISNMATQFEDLFGSLDTQMNPGSKAFSYDTNIVI